jgi:subtilisin family serine protease
MDVMRKLVPFAVAFLFVLSLIPGGRIAQAELPPAAPAWRPAPSELKMAPAVEAAIASLQPGEMITVIVTLRDQADLSQIVGAGRAARQQGVIRALQAKAAATQRSILALLSVRSAQGSVDQVTPFWVLNALAVTATSEVIQELAARADVQSITPDGIEIVPAQLPAEPNLSVVNTPALWGLGYTGQGVVVANMDSGVDVSHPDLAGRWRGGANSWFDPYGQHPSTPADLSGHGTWTMGVMVGGGAGGTSIGVAPDARWIAVKIFNDQGGATASAIHLGFQWLLDPDNNPATPDAPHVVNNSWTNAYPGCDLEFELDLEALRAAGILPVFAAGNGGPSAGTSYSPANNPSALAVGATDDLDAIYAYSSRGPSSCGEATTVFPEIVAPGVAIHTSDLAGLYTDATGTSLAAPHVAGGLALLLSAFPDLSAAQQQDALLSSAVDLGPAGPDNDFGYGRVDLLAAYQWLVTAPPTPTPTPDPTINLALNRPVTVSSFQDGAHDGPQAVDGDLGTFWQTAKATGKGKLPSEWIEIDLGSGLSVGTVVLEWADNYATTYVIQVSADHATWSTVFSTSTGDGANDTVTFGPAVVRYVRLESTAWSNGSQRNWLREFEVYAGDGNPAPTPTPPPPTPTPSPTPVPSPTPTPDPGATMHAGDLDGLASPAGRNRWDATVTILVHDAAENPISGATVSATWSGGVSGSGSCVTDGTGACAIAERNIKGNVGSVILTVDAVSHPALIYEPAANHDPDGDSDGTSITIPSP